MEDIIVTVQHHHSYIINFDSECEVKQLVIFDCGNCNVTLPDKNLFNGRTLHIVKKNAAGVLRILNRSSQCIMNIESNKRMYEFTSVNNEYNCEEHRVEDIEEENNGK
jgi:hypothetical protein